jgi:ADP-ribose pyrophosphatase YjhB (NUDIX family)
VSTPAPAAIRFCSACGSDRIEHRIPEGDNLPRYVCANCATIHYQNPKIVVGCLPEWQEQLLLCRRAIEPRYGLWTLPAGFLENGETVTGGAVRETLEEAGARVAVGDLYTMISLPHISQVYMMFRARLVDLDFSAGPESLEVRLFPRGRDPLGGDGLPHDRPHAPQLLPRPQARPFPDARQRAREEGAAAGPRGRGLKRPFGGASGFRVRFAAIGTNDPWRRPQAQAAGHHPLEASMQILRTPFARLAAVAGAYHRACAHPVGALAADDPDIDHDRRHRWCLLSDGWRHGQHLSKSVPGLTATAEVTGGSVDNLKLINAGKSEVGFSMADAGWDAYQGLDKFKDGKVNARTLMVLYPNKMHIVTIEGTGINKLSDLKGKRVSTGSPGSGTEIIAFASSTPPASTARRTSSRSASGAAESVNAIKDPQDRRVLLVGRRSHRGGHGPGRHARHQDEAHRSRRGPRRDEQAIRSALREKRHPGRGLPWPGQAQCRD